MFTFTVALPCSVRRLTRFSEVRVGVNDWPSGEKSFRFWDNIPTGGPVFVWSNVVSTRSCETTRKLTKNSKPKQQINTFEIIAPSFGTSGNHEPAPVNPRLKPPWGKPGSHLARKLTYSEAETESGDFLKSESGECPNSRRGDVQICTHPLKFSSQIPTSGSIGFLERWG